MLHIGPYKWNEACPLTKLATAWFSMLLTFSFISYVSRVLVNSKIESSHCLQICRRSSGFAQILPEIWVGFVYVSTPTVTSWWSHWVVPYGSSSLWFVRRRLMLWHFVSDSHKVMTTLIVVLQPSKCCCHGDFLWNVIAMWYILEI
jgi:hypothetical protein